MQKPWEGRFREKTEELVEEFTQSVSFDQRLALQDIRQNLAHLKALRMAGIVSEEEEKLIRKGLEEIEQEVKENRMEFSKAWEDVHMNIERRLIEKVGR
jgi:argininosuccinate lyase